MYQVKHFSSRDVLNEFEKNVNKWFEKNDVEVIDIQYKTTTYGNLEDLDYSVLILYKYKQTES